MFGSNMYNILLIVLVCGIIYLVLSKTNVFNVREKYEDDKSTSNSSTVSVDSSEAHKMPIKSAIKTAPTGHRNVDGASLDSTPAPNAEMPQNVIPSDSEFPKQKELKPEDLLPKDMNTKWAQVNPTGQGLLADRNFLDAGHHVGINTVGQTNRNANYSLRSEIPNPQIKVSPWLQSTIDPDVGRKPLEIGSGW